MHSAALLQLSTALSSVVLDAGLLTDELTIPDAGTASASSNPIDQRELLDGDQQMIGEKDYARLQGVRQLTNQAIGALAKYDTAYQNDEAGPAKVQTGRYLRGEMWAIQGYAEILLAELFCSGVPLTTLDFEKDFTYQPGSTSAEVYRSAAAKFDTALALASDSAPIANLARVGKGRALLNLGLYDSAAAAVAAVPDSFQYNSLITLVPAFSLDTGNPCLNNIPYFSFQCFWQLADQEGGNGIPFLSSGDPRSEVTPPSSDYPGYPAKYQAAFAQPTSFVSLSLATGLEARLITAEAALHNAARWGDWLAPLNVLRTETGGVSGLAPLSDPGTPEARIDLVFHERAEWLYLTAHRQGDLRRLIRQYDRPEQEVYPSGPYPASDAGNYGNSVVVPIPSTERLNPLFRGCYDLRA
jgi:hypothetical protein